MSNDKVSQAIVRLFEHEMFYAEIIMSMRRITSHRVPTAGVCIKDQIELYINPDFFDALTIDEGAAVLKHEAEHILRDHISRMKDYAPEIYNDSKDLADNIINNMKHKALNIAADCAINCHIKGLPEGSVYPKMFDLIDNQTTEWYIDQLKDNEKMKQKMGFDDHSIWGDSEGEKEIIKEKIRQAIDQAASKTRAAGRMTSDNELAVSSLNKASINWKQQLRRFVAKTIETRVESSKKKRNRRYGIIIPGSVKLEDLHIGVAIDTSGSVSDDALIQFMAEIGQIAKYAKVTVVEADSEIKNSYVFKPKKTYNVKGRGGTAYQPALTYYNDTDVDALIYFGDMDNYDSEVLTKPKYPVLWAIVGNSNPPASFGAQIRIKV